MAQQVEPGVVRRSRSGPDGAGAERRTRSVRRRRGLPGSRSVVGGLLVAAAAVGLFAAASDSGSGPTRSYVVTREQLPAGHRIEAADLALVPMDLAPAQQARAFDSAQPLLGATVVAGLGVGELVQSSAVVARAGETASRELSFVLDRGRMGTAIKQGERADLLATYGTGTDAFTVVVVRQALLVAIDRPRTTAGDAGAATVTVAVDSGADVLALAHAIQLAKVTLVRATGAPPLVGVSPTFTVGKP